MRPAGRSATSGMWKGRLAESQKRLSSKAITSETRNLGTFVGTNLSEEALRKLAAENGLPGGHFSLWRRLTGNPLLSDGVSCSAARGQEPPRWVREARLAGAGRPSSLRAAGWGPIGQVLLLVGMPKASSALLTPCPIASLARVKLGVKRKRARAPPILVPSADPALGALFVGAMITQTGGRALRAGNVFGSASQAAARLQRDQPAWRRTSFSHAAALPNKAFPLRFANGHRRESLPSCREGSNFQPLRVLGGIRPGG